MRGMQQGILQELRNQKTLHRPQQDLLSLPAVQALTFRIHTTKLEYMLHVQGSV